MFGSAAIGDTSVPKCRLSSIAYTPVLPTLPAIWIAKTLASPVVEELCRVNGWPACWVITRSDPAAITYSGVMSFLYLMAPAVGNNTSVPVAGTWSVRVVSAASVCSANVCRPQSNGNCSGVFIAKLLRHLLFSLIALCAAGTNHAFVVSAFRFKPQRL
ncbi:hypothetical protein SAMN05444008_111132 [Cnuella takakiae]|uniref:Uncharacterized protein n=1 Tax=Cnuella takakiae TaxID=1302690 RepID=A0A1M5DYD4_9BACT|nr:hypothetical protein SAMN05444008_111132 [Cnuella takakiae]